MDLLTFIILKLKSYSLDYLFYFTYFFSLSSYFTIVQCKRLDVTETNENFNVKNLHSNLENNDYFWRKSEKVKVDGNGKSNGNDDGYNDHKNANDVDNSRMMNIKSINKNDESTISRCMLLFLGALCQQGERPFYFFFLLSRSLSP